MTQEGKYVMELNLGYFHY